MKILICVFELESYLLTGKSEKNMKMIKLFGDIAKNFKAEWSLDVMTPSEALRAINANRPGFLSECDKGNYI